MIDHTVKQINANPVFPGFEVGSKLKSREELRKQWEEFKKKQVGRWRIGTVG